MIEAVTNKLQDGITFSLMLHLELEVVELRGEKIPCAEMGWFDKNGSDVTLVAVRGNIAYTGRDKVSKFSYHPV